MVTTFDVRQKSNAVGCTPPPHVDLRPTPSVLLHLVTSPRCCGARLRTKSHATLYGDDNSNLFMIRLASVNWILARVLIEKVAHLSVLIGGLECADGRAHKVHLTFGESDYAYSGV